MKKIVLLLAAGLALAASPGSAQINSYSSAATSNYSADNAATITFDFDSAATTPLVTGGRIGSAVVGDVRAAPIGSIGNFFSVGTSDNGIGDTADLFFGTLDDVSSVSFLWGSMDDYNQLQFIDALGNAVGSVFYGAAMSEPVDTANGDQQAAGTNRLVTFTFEGADQAVRGMRLTSLANAFEIDSVTVATAVPEPATWAMMLVGLFSVSAMTRRRRAANAVFA